LVDKIAPPTEDTLHNGSPAMVPHLLRTSTRPGPDATAHRTGLVWCDGGVRADVLNYPIHQRILHNGMRVLISPDRSVPIVAVNLWYDVGSRDEAPGQFGWAHLFEHLMFSGSANVASGEHLHLLQSLGGSVNATTWFDRTNYFETVPVGALDLALWLEADRLNSLADHLSLTSVNTQRDVVKEEKRQRYDNVPYGDAMAALTGLIFGAAHPYGHTTIGSMDDLDGATKESAAEFFRNHYRPDNAVLTLVGDVTPREGFRKVERAFGHLPAWNRKQRPAPTSLPALSGIPTTTLTGTVPAQSSYLAWRLPTRDGSTFDAADLALAILGAGQTSRLHQVLVRERRLAAGTAASAVPLIGGNSIGLVQLRALPHHEVGLAVDAALTEIERFISAGPTEQELARAKAQFAREWLTDLARFDTRADLISAFATLHDDPARINRRLEEVSAITSEDVSQAARDFLQPSQRAQLDYLQEAEDAAL
jgi:zinc protease